MERGRYLDSKLQPVLGPDLVKGEGQEVTGKPQIVERGTQIIPIDSPGLEQPLQMRVRTTRVVVRAGRKLACS